VYKNSQLIAKKIYLEIFASCAGSLAQRIRSYPKLSEPIRSYPKSVYFLPIFLCFLLPFRGHRNRAFPRLSADQNISGSIFLPSTGRSNGNRQTPLDTIGHH
jgi:hypothetical protein